MLSYLKSQLHLSVEMFLPLHSVVLYQAVIFIPTFKILSAHSQLQKKWQVLGNKYWAKMIVSMPRKYNIKSWNPSEELIRSLSILVIDY